MLADIHHHFVYGVDDGARNEEIMRQMLTRAYDQGVSELVATSHATPGVEYFPYETYLENLKQAKSFVNENGYDMNLYPGCEIYYTDDAVRLLNEHKIPTIGGTRYVLVEFSPRDDYDRLLDAASALGRAGYQPIFAHVERYECLNRMERLEELHDDMDIILQVNCSTAMDHGFFSSRWFKKAMKMELIDLVSSDAHNVSTRRCRMMTCYESLKADYGKETARRLCRETALEILSRAKPLK